MLCVGALDTGCGTDPGTSVVSDGDRVDVVMMGVGHHTDTFHIVVAAPGGPVQIAGFSANGGVIELPTFAPCSLAGGSDLPGTRFTVTASVAHAGHVISSRQATIVLGDDIEVPGVNVVLDPDVHHHVPGAQPPAADHQALRDSRGFRRQPEHRTGSMAGHREGHHRDVDDSVPRRSHLRRLPRRWLVSGLSTRTPGEPSHVGHMFGDTGSRMPVSQLMSARMVVPDPMETGMCGHLGKTCVVTTTST